MPYGHNKQYRELVLEAQRKRLQITRQQQQQIARLYRDIAKDMGKEIAKKSERTLTYRWLKDYAKALKNQSKILYSDIQGIVSLGILNTAEAFVDAEQAFWSGLVPGLSERFRDTFSSIPQTCVDELMNGGIYKDFTGLSERIWAYQKKYDRDIGYMIERGIVAQKSAYELAKDLEMYVNPKAKKPWEWQKVYPNCNRVVDYNAQRLARTSVTHAYQLSFQRATKDNPFVEQYQWNSSNAGKTCELCAERDGKLFDKDKLPLDHPNGMCVVTAVISKELDEIAEELNDWADGGSNPALDKWLDTKETGRLKKKKHTVENPLERSIIISGAVSGARNPYGKAADKQAERYYGLVRSMTTDVKKIAKTTGYSEQEIQNIKDYIFIDEHDLGDRGVRRFDADYMMGESWRRLMEGSPEQHDLTMIHHEIMEKRLMQEGLSQNEAHIRASAKYNYAKEANEFYDKIKKFKKE